MSRVCNRNAEAGFSLVEALVALGVFATACIGIISMQTQSTRALAQLETRTLAGLVAQNILVGVNAADSAPPDGISSTAVTLGKRAWTVTTDVAPTPDATIRRVRVSVRETANGPVRADLTAFVSIDGGAP